MVTFISDTALVRRLARNVTTSDFTDNQIVKEQEAAYAKIGIKTGRFDWDDTDSRFAAIQKLEEMLAAAYILQHYGAGSPEEVNWIQFWAGEVKDGLQELVDEGVDVEADLDVLIATSAAESYPSSLVDDANAVPYRSTTEVL